MLCFELYEYLRGEVNKVQRKKGSQIGSLTCNPTLFYYF